MKKGYCEAFKDKGVAKAAMDLADSNMKNKLYKKLKK